tara:strand:- start:80 stop:262 length:183 start_codon:yes stop_codon:yes gene_type:complete
MNNDIVLGKDEVTSGVDTWPETCTPPKKEELYGYPEEHLQLQLQPVESTEDVPNYIIYQK